MLYIVMTRTQECSAISAVICSRSTCCSLAYRYPFPPSDLDYVLGMFGTLLYRCPSWGKSWRTHFDGAQGGCENSEPRQDPSLGHGGEGQEGNKYPEALSTSAHREAARDHRYS